ncbi:hypothetical protein Tco_1215780 [Tanacetum coccineum]
MESERYLLNYLGLEVGSIRRIQVLDTTYWGFLGVGTTLDIFQNIHILYLEYDARIRRIFLDGYGVLVFRIVIFKISSFKLQNARLLLSFTNYSIITGSTIPPEFTWWSEYQSICSIDIVILFVVQHLPIDASPTALSLGYVADSDSSKEDPKEDSADYPADEGDDKLEENEEPSKDDEEEEASEEDEDEEDEHLTLANYVALPSIDPVPSAEETKPFETNESAATPPPPRSPQTRVPFS